MKRRAFTLIELLVVIAIIAILAAILFPVFAQAKVAAKKTQAIANVKNLVTASLMYTTDYDDSFGFGVPFIPTLGWAADRFIPHTRLLKTTTPAPVADGINTHFGNAVEPYKKNTEMMRDPMGIPQNPLPAGAFTAAGIVAADIPADFTAISYTYNGLLQAQSSSVINQVAKTILWWPGMGKRALIGAHYASPQLLCDDATKGCVYVAATPTSPACSTTNNGTSSFYSRSSSNKGWDLYARTLVYAYADGHVSSRRIGVYTSGRTDPRTDPFALYNGEQVPLSPNPSRWWEPRYCHPYLFRPDADHDNLGTALQAN